MHLFKIQKDLLTLLLFSVAYSHGAALADISKYQQSLMKAKNIMLNTSDYHAAIEKFKKIIACYTK